MAYADLVSNLLSLMQLINSCELSSFVLQAKVVDALECSREVLKCEVGNIHISKVNIGWEQFIPLIL